jgi:spore maturation protein CgeB
MKFLTDNDPSGIAGHGNGQTPGLRRPAGQVVSGPGVAELCGTRRRNEENGHVFSELKEKQSQSPLKIVILGLSITSSWGNGHATTYRGLVRQLAGRGHRVLFLERDVEWYACNRDLPKPPYCRVALYSSLKELKDRFATAVRNADLVMVGSYVQEGISIGEWVTKVAQGATAFYDIDTPVTLAKLSKGDLEYLSAALIPKYNIYFSFTGGPILNVIEKRYGSPQARALYCSVDPELYYPEAQAAKWDLGYMGTYSDDRQPALDELLLQPAREWSRGKFVVAGPQYPRSVHWPRNVRRRTHLAPAKHRGFYNAQRFTLNITRANMVEAGYSPSVRLFEAAACGTPIISDFWEGLDSFFKPGREILIARSSRECLNYLLEMPETERRAVGERARALVLANHTARHRALELESCIRRVLTPYVPA